jgi:hypothetical protein
VLDDAEKKSKTENEIKIEVSGNCSEEWQQKILHNIINNLACTVLLVSQGKRARKLVFSCFS